MQTTISLIKKTFKQVYKKELPLDHLVFLYTAAAGTLMSIFGLGYNIANNIGLFTLPVLALYLVSNILSVLYSIVKNRWHGAAVIVLGSSAFLLVPFLWFTVGGVTGSTPPIMFTAGICIAIVFKGALRTVMLVAETIMLIAFIVLEFNFPDIIIPYANRAEHYSDLAFGLTMSFIANTVLIYTVVGQYVKAQDEKMRLVHRLEHLSMTDALTGLNNRRYLSASIDDEMRHAYDTGAQLTLCILDIDHFKKINDTYGHEYGDEVLCSIAQIMKASLTDGEIFGRYGGEEFVVLFPGKTPQKSMSKVQALADHVRTHEWNHGKPVTISGGLSNYFKGSLSLTL